MAQNPRLSVKERDRRYSLLRQQLRQRGIDCTIVSGSNLFYLGNGIPGELYGFLTTDEKPFTVIVNRRHLVDVPVQVLIDAQEWVGDFKPGNDAAPLIEKIKELGLEKGTVGLSGGISYRFTMQLQSALPAAKIVDVTDLFTDVRTLKSAE